MASNGSTKAIEKAGTLITVAASLATTAMLVRTVINDYLPYQVQDYIYSTVSNLFTRSTSEVMTIVIAQTEGFVNNEVYDAVAIYLGGMVSPTTKRLKVCKQENDSSVVVTVDRGEKVVDVFEGIEFQWFLTAREGCKGRRSGDRDQAAEVFVFELSFHRKHKDTVLGRYLPHVMERSKAIREGDKAIKLHTLSSYDSWSEVNLDHPATFDTVALDPEMKQMLISDLEKRKDFYRRVGKPWKRGYLLYGPPGTGKSSLIVAMANHLKFDIYDLELTQVSDNTCLRSALLTASNHSIIVVEDIDCTIDLTNRETADGPPEHIYNDPGGSRVTLSGLLNCIDGLWSSCGDGRIVVFTTNHKERLDPALLRPGRMDLHVHLSYCTLPMFRVLMMNYHSVDGHAMLPEIERLMTEVEVTPAEVAGELMRSDDADVALGYLEKLLLEKKEKKDGEAEVEVVAAVNGKSDQEKSGMSQEQQIFLGSIPPKEENNQRQMIRSTCYAMTLDEPVLGKYLKTSELQELQKIKLSSTSIAALEVSLQEVHSSCSPKATEYENRGNLVHIIDALVKNIYGNVDGFPLVEAFGSFVMDMFTADSDLDLSINFSSSETCPFSRDKKISILKEFLKVLYANQRKGNLHHVQPILRARVPIVKFIDRNTGIECDVSVENKDGITKSFIIFLISSIDERFQILSCLMKLWAKAHEINSSKDHTLNSLSIILLVAFHLQTRDPPILPPFSAVLKGRVNRAELQDIVSQFKHYGRANKETIAELFVSLFCKLSSVETLWEQGICASTYEGFWILKKWGSEVGIISVEDFTDRSQNCARAVKKDEFKTIYRCIHNTIGHISFFGKDRIEFSLKELLFGRVTLHIPKQPFEGVEDASHKRKYFLESTVTGPVGKKKRKKVGKKKEPSKDQTTTEPVSISRKRERLLEDETATEADPAIPAKKTIKKASKKKRLSKNQTATKSDMPTKTIVRACSDRDTSLNQADNAQNHPVPTIPIHTHHGNIRTHNNFAPLPSVGALHQQGHSFFPPHTNYMFSQESQLLPLQSLNPPQNPRRLPYVPSVLSYGMQPPQQIPYLPSGQSYPGGLQQESQFPHIPSGWYMPGFQPPQNSFLPSGQGYVQGFQQPTQTSHRHMPGLQQPSQASHLPPGQSYMLGYLQPTHTPLPTGQSYMSGLQHPQIHHLTNGQSYLAQLQQPPQFLSRSDNRPYR